MDIYRYVCLDCKFEEVANDEDFYCPDVCPNCGKPIMMYTYIKSLGNKYRVLMSKRAKDLKVGDMFYDRYHDDAHMILGVKSTTKKLKPAINIGIKNVGSRTYLEDDIVYCAYGLWEENKK